MPHQRALKGKRDRIWRHGQKNVMWCVKCGSHVEGTMKREGPFWTFECPCGFSARKGLTKPKENLYEEGLLEKNNMGVDPRAKGRKLHARLQHQDKMDRAKHRIAVRELGQAKMYR